MFLRKCFLILNARSQAARRRYEEQRRRDKFYNENDAYKRLNRRDTLQEKKKFNLSNIFSKSVGSRLNLHEVRVVRMRISRQQVNILNTFKIFKLITRSNAINELLFFCLAHWPVQI